MLPPQPIFPRMTSLIDRPRLAELLESASACRVAVVGDAMLDVYLRGDAERISPEAPVPIVRVRDRKYALGGAANVAQNVAAAGARSELVAAIGADESGRRLREMLDLVAGGHASLVEVDRPTTTKTRLVARAQQIVRFDEEDDSDLTGGGAERLLDAALEAIDRADALVLEDYNKGVLVPHVIGETIARAQSRGIPIVVDPKYRNFFAYRGATVFKPNRRELEAALGASVELDAPDTLPLTLDRLGAAHLLLTLGSNGMAIISGAGDVRRIPTTAREVYDVVGAGDTVTAYLATSLAAGATAYEAAVIANYAAGVEVGKLGAATVSASEVLEAFDVRNDGR